MTLQRWDYEINHDEFGTSVEFDHAADGEWVKSNEAEAELNKFKDYMTATAAGMTDEITKLEAENERLRSERDAIISQVAKG